MWRQTGRFPNGVSLSDKVNLCQRYCSYWSYHCLQAREWAIWLLEIAFRHTCSPCILRFLCLVLCEVYHSFSILLSHICFFFLPAICSVIMLLYLVTGTPSPQITIIEMPGICFPLCDSVWIMHVLLCTYMSTSAFLSVCVVVENLEVLS